MRLVGTVSPLRESDRPSDNFERQANTLAMVGQPYKTIEYVGNEWY